MIFTMLNGVIAPISMGIAGLTSIVCNWVLKKKQKQTEAEMTQKMEQMQKKIAYLQKLEEERKQTKRTPNWLESMTEEQLELKINTMVHSAVEKAMQEQTTVEAVNKQEIIQTVTQTVTTAVKEELKKAEAKPKEENEVMAMAKEIEMIPTAPKKVILMKPEMKVQKPIDKELTEIEEIVLEQHTAFLGEKTSKELSVELNCSERTINRARMRLKDKGYKEKERSQMKTTTTTTDREEIDRIITLHFEKTNRELSEMANCSETTIRRRRSALKACGTIRAGA